MCDEVEEAADDNAEEAEDKEGAWGGADLDGALVWATGVVMSKRDERKRWA